MILGVSLLASVHRGSDSNRDVKMNIAKILTVVWLAYGLYNNDHAVTAVCLLILIYNELQGPPSP
jgi:hypothetical protein